MTLPTKTKGEPTLDNSRRFFITFQEQGIMEKYWAMNPHDKVAHHLT
jgi:hypothetical protein